MLLTRRLGLAAMLGSALSGPARAEGFPGAEWEHAAPAEAGWSEAGLAALRDWGARLPEPTPDQVGRLLRLTLRAGGLGPT